MRYKFVLGVLGFLSYFTRESLIRFLLNGRFTDDLDSTTWISELYNDSLPPHAPPPSQSYSTRLGSLSLLVFALVALVTSLLLPYLSNIGHSHWIRPYSTSPSRFGAVLRKVLIGMNMRNFWTMGLSAFAMLMGLTWFIQGVAGGMTIVGGLGVCWAVNCWVS